MNREVEEIIANIKTELQKIEELQAAESKTIWKEKDIQSMIGNGDYRQYLSIGSRAYFNINGDKETLCRVVDFDADPISGSDENAAITWKTEHVIDFRSMNYPEIVIDGEIIKGTGCACTFPDTLMGKYLAKMEASSLIRPVIKSSYISDTIGRTVLDTFVAKLWIFSRKEMFGFISEPGKCYKFFDNPYSKKAFTIYGTEEPCWLRTTSVTARTEYYTNCSTKKPQESCGVMIGFCT